MTSGCSSDLQAVSQMAGSAIRFAGFSQLGPIFAQREEISDKTNLKLDTEVQNILSESYERVKKLLIDNRAALDAIKELLLEKETVDDKQIIAVIKNKIYEGYHIQQ